MPRRKQRQVKVSMYGWNDQFAVLRRECFTVRRKFTRSKGDALLYEVWKSSKAALRRGIKRSRIHCLKDLIGEFVNNPWGLAFKIVTKRLVIRRKTPGLDNPDRVKYIARRLFPHVEPFQRQDRSSCVFRRGPLEEALSYRPICLLDTMGKFLEELILQRFQSILVGENGLSENQFRFRNGRLTVDAIQAVVMYEDLLRLEPASLALRMAHLSRMPLKTSSQCCVGPDEHSANRLTRRRPSAKMEDTDSSRDRRRDGTVKRPGDGRTV